MTITSVAKRQYITIVQGKEIAFFWIKRFNNAYFVLPNNHALFSFHHVIIIWLCIFFFGEFFFYKVYALLREFLCLKNQWAEYFQNDNESGFISCTVTYVHVKCLNTCTYISPNVLLIYTELWTDY